MGRERGFTAQNAGFVRGVEEESAARHFPGEAGAGRGSLGGASRGPRAGSSAFQEPRALSWAMMFWPFGPGICPKMGRGSLVGASRVGVSWPPKFDR